LRYCHIFILKNPQKPQKFPLNPAWQAPETLVSHAKRVFLKVSGLFLMAKMASCAMDKSVGSYCFLQWFSE
jgi:hypothetical protein